MLAVTSSLIVHRVLEDPFCNLQYVSYAFRSLVMRGMKKKKKGGGGIFINVSLVTAVCKPDILLFVCAT